MSDLLDGLGASGASGAAWLVWSGGASAPGLHGLVGVSTSRLHRRRYSAGSWPAGVVCEATPGWREERPEASVVDGLPLVSAALGALLPDVELWPVGIEGVGSEMVVRYAVIPRQVVELLGGGGSSAPVAGVHGLVVDRGRLAAMGVGVVGVARVPNVVLVREDVAQRLWESGASGVEFTAPEAFVMQFGALSPGEHARLEALLAEARSAAVRVAAEVEVGAAVAGQIEGGQIGGRSLEVWLGEAWAYRGVPHFASVGLDPGEFVDEVVAAWREALAEALARRAG